METRAAARSRSVPRAPDADRRYRGILSAKRIFLPVFMASPRAGRSGSRDPGIEHQSEGNRKPDEPEWKGLSAPLRELHELGYREIANVTGVPLRTVMSRLHRARSLLLRAWDLTDAE